MKSIAFTAGRRCLAFSVLLCVAGGASAAAVVAFAAEVRGQVRDCFGVALEPEPRLLGFEAKETAALFA